jgi:hypothetical protein
LPVSALRRNMWHICNWIATSEPVETMKPTVSKTLRLGLGFAQRPV